MNKEFPLKTEFAWLFFANAVDALLTAHLITEHEGVEVNPIVNLTISSGIPYFFLFKFSVMTFALLLSYWRWSKKKVVTPSKKVWHILCVIYALIVVWNIAMLCLSVIVNGSS